MAAWIVAGTSLVIWFYLAVGHGGFWRTSVGLPAGTGPLRWPSVVAVVPARDEAAVLPRALATLIAQDYPGPWRVVVVDDDSTDATAALAATGGAEVVSSPGPAAGWSGKVAAMAAGIERAGDAEYLLLTDADVAFPPDAVTGLVRAAVTNHLDLTSQMVRLRAESAWERLVVPAFVYFFGQLYPFSWVNRPGRVAAAAGGCMLVRRTALVRAGGLEQIRDAVIDDVALGRLLKRRGRIWLGLSDTVASVRPYPRLTDLWHMVARSAYVQLRCSPVLLAATLAGLVLIYAVPPVSLVAGLLCGDVLLAVLGAAAWTVMAATYVPMLRFYGLSGARSALLPAVAMLYAAMTVDSARRHLTGQGAAWKGRAVGRETHR